MKKNGARVLIEENSIRKLQKKLLLLQRNSKDFTIATASRNSNNKVILRIESRHNKHEINYDAAFSSDANRKTRRLIDYVGLKQLSLTRNNSQRIMIIIMMVKNSESNNKTLITIAINSVEWFTARKGSFTSYHTNTTINACFVYLS